MCFERWLAFWVERVFGSTRRTEFAVYNVMCTYMRAHVYFTNLWLVIYLHVVRLFQSRVERRESRRETRIELRSLTWINSAAKLVANLSPFAPTCRKIEWIANFALTFLTRRYSFSFLDIKAAIPRNINFFPVFKEFVTILSISWMLRRSQGNINKYIFHLLRNFQRSNCRRDLFYLDFHCGSK